MNLIEEITNNYPTDKKAALYYKTEPFFSGINYSHTNNWEIFQSVEILNRKGFAVDLIDRSNSDWSPSKKFDLFLGLGVGNAGRNFVQHSTASKARVSVLLSMGPQPDISNELVLKRYDIFKERTGVNAPPMRTVTEVTGENFKKIITKADYVFNIGQKNNNSYKSFLPYGKPVLNFYPSSSPDVKYNNSWAKSRNRNSFLCFAGNGFICKGVDLVVESFLKNPTKTLHICGPQSETAFFNYYKKRISDSPNIKYHGFVTPGGDLFNQLASECSYVIFHSAAEGCCTSVATAMRAGLVPIINPWTGIITEDLVLSEENSDDDGRTIIDTITQTVNEASKMPYDNYVSLTDKTLEQATLFSQDSFTKSYSEALDIVTDENNL